MPHIPSDAEFGILTFLWRCGPCTVREVHEALAKDTGYTSTLKQMQLMPPVESVFPEVCDVQSFVTKPDRMNLAGSRNTTMALLAASLSTLGRLGRPVVDRTGIDGRVDFTIEWVRESPAAQPDALPDVQGPAFVDALREQLGLKLEAAKGSMELLVVDRIERPSEN